jgi:selenocysteine-specific elongation factor
MHVVGTAGHVDHGKSTLVRALTGIDPDRFEEEKRRGLTIDLGFAWRTLPSGREIGIVDVPGHERFIRNMLAGAGGVDVALFVVAADEGWMPQSAEHLQVLDFLDVRGGVVALTKTDLVDEELLDLVRDDVWQQLRGTCLHDAAIVPVSASTEAGLEDLVEALDSLLATTPTATDRRRPRLFVDRSFTIAGAGTVVTGTLVGGSFRVGETVQVLPDGATARIRSLHTHRRSVDEAVPGSRVAINLVGLERVDVIRGDAVVRPDEWLLTDTFAARLRAASSLDHALTERGAYELYVGSAEVACRVKFLEETEAATTAVGRSRGVALGLPPGADLLVQVFCARELPVVHGDRFVIRDVGRRETVAGGGVIDIAPGTIRRGDVPALTRLREREVADRDELARRIVRDRGIVGRTELARFANISRIDLDGRIADLEGVVIVGDFVADAAYVDELRRRAIDLVSAHHREHPLDAGLPREALYRALGDGGILIAAWERDGVLVADRNMLRLPSHGDAMASEDREEAERILDALRHAGSSPPPLSDVGAPIALARAMERAGQLVRVAADIAYPADVWAQIERQVADIVGRSPATVSQLREAIGTTRKYAVPLLEKLDATGVTRRKGDVRELGPRGRELLAERDA